MFSLFGYMILMLWFGRKSFSFHIIRRIKVHSSNKINLDSCNNVHSFCYRHYSHVLHIGILDIDAWDLQEKLFFLPFSLQSELIYEMGQTWILIKNSIPFCYGHYNQVPLIAICAIDALDLQEKHFFPLFSL